MMLSDQRALQEVMDEGTQFTEGQIGEGFIVDNKNTIHLVGKLRQLKPNGLVETATDSVAANGGFEDFFGDNHTKTLMVMGVGCVNQR